MTGRTFETGASRNGDDGKLDFEAYLSPQALRRYAEYMRANSELDGEPRTGDNWQRGIPVEAYAKSLWRHVYDVWALHRGAKPLDETHDLESALCGVLFNAFGMLHEALREAEAHYPPVSLPKPLCEHCGKPVDGNLDHLTREGYRLFWSCPERPLPLPPSATCVLCHAYLAPGHKCAPT